MNFQSFGVTNQRTASSSIDLIAEEVRIKGFSIVNDVLKGDNLAMASKKVDEVYGIQEEKFGKDRLTLIKEQDLARCLLAYDEFFLREVAANPYVVSVIEKFLGNYFILHLQSGIINRPQEAHHQNSWHRDLPYQNFVISKPLSMNAMFCIDKFTEENGCTYVVPFTHREETVPSVEYIEKNKVPLVAPAGSVVFFDSMILHRAGYNSSNAIRRGINNIYVSPIIKQQIDLPKMLKGKYSEDPFLSQFLGYSSDVPVSDEDLRERRLKRGTSKSM